MNLYLKLIISCCICSVFFLCLSMNTYSVPTKHIPSVSYLDDIPAKDVNCIFNDSKGFIWIGTLDGLHRYDGYQYKTYRIDATKNSISSNLIIDIDEDSHGNIWIGTYGKGVCMLNPGTDIFTHFDNKLNTDQQLPRDVTDLMVDDQDCLWIVNWFGVTRARFDSSMQKIQDVRPITIQPTFDGLKQASKCIFQDQDKNIWVGTNHQTMRITNPYENKDEIKFENFPRSAHTICQYEDGILVGGSAVVSITKRADNSAYEEKTELTINADELVLKDQTLWIGNRNGVYAFQKNTTGEWDERYHLDKNQTDNSLSSNIVTAVASDDFGQIWVGTRGGGVNIVKPMPNRFEHYKHSLNKGSLSNDLTRSMFEDSYENLWIGTEYGGVNLLRKGGSYINGFKTLIINPQSNENRVYAIEETKTPLSKNHKSLIWFGTSYYKSLAAFDPVSLKEKNLDQTITDGLGFIFTLEAQDDTTLWIGTYDKGVWKLTLDQEGNIIQQHNYSPGSTPPSAVLSYIIRSIFIDSNGNLWIGTDKGINFIPAAETTKENPKIESFVLGQGADHLSHDYILQVIESKKGVIWIGTMGGGLIRCDEASPGKLSFNTITTHDGLPNNTIKTIVEDQDGFLWLASNHGLTKYNPTDGSIVNYDKADGLQDNEFSEICGIKRKSSEIVMGGIKGFNTFNPHEITNDQVKPKLYFTDFYILNKLIGCGDTLDGMQILSNTIEYTKSINLNYKHNSFSIGFVGIQFNSPGKTHYRYKLEGFDKEWYKASADHRIAKYTNVPDGDYTFKVMASNSDNIWTDHPIELNITIKPPLHRTNWAIATYILIALLLSYLIYRIVRTIQKRKRDVLISKMEKEQIEEISRLRLQFFTNISHEFRTPLSLITTPLEQLTQESKETISPEQQKHLNLIKHNVGVMTRLIDQLLDFRKLDQNKVRIHPSEQSLNQFLENIYNAFTVLAGQKKIDYQFIPVDGDDTVWIDVDKMEKVIYNLLSNAFKYSNENSKIVLKAEVLAPENQYQITVSDNGVGINDDEKVHIFERYYQANNKTKQNITGTGIGLALAKGFVDLHEGQIGFYNNEPTGTIFFVRLRMGHAHFPAEILTEQTIKQAIEPINQALEPDDQMDENQSGRKNTHLPKLLVVEDNYDLRKQIKGLFRNEFRVIEAEDGQAGLTICREQLPDVIITDLMMPNMDGIEMCKMVKNDENTSHIPVLILTAKNTDDTQIEGYETGADGYLPKPFSTEVLKASVRSLLKNREHLRQRFQKEIEINPDLVSNTPADARFLEKILDLINANMDNADYSVDQLASDYGVSRIYLNRKLKALTGETTTEFIRNIKLKYAAGLLKQNKLNISEVAWEIGYNDIRTFRKRFKDKFQQSPSEFAKQFKTD